MASSTSEKKKKTSSKISEKKKTSPKAQKTSPKKSAENSVKTELVAKKKTVKKTVTEKKPQKTTSEKVAKTSPKKVSAKKKSVESADKKNAIVPPLLSENLAPESKKETITQEEISTDNNVFTTIIALFIVALVILGWFIFSRYYIAPRTNPPVPEQPLPPAQPQYISVASSVVLSEEVVSGLSEIADQVMLDSDEVLQAVYDQDDEVPSDFAFLAGNAQPWDMVFVFTKRVILYRPSLKQVVQSGDIPGTL